MKRAMLIAAAFWTVSAGTAWPIDQIYTSTSEKPYFGKIISMTATAINFEPQRKADRRKSRPTRSCASSSRTRPTA